MRYENKEVANLIDVQGSHLPASIQKAFAFVPATEPKDKVTKLFNAVNNQYNAAKSILRNSDQVESITRLLAGYVKSRDQDPDVLSAIIQTFRTLEQENSDRIEGIKEENRKKAEKAAKEKAEKEAQKVREEKLKSLDERYQKLALIIEEDEKDKNGIVPEDQRAYSEYVKKQNVEEIETLLNTIEKRKSDRQKLKKELETLQSAFFGSSDQKLIYSFGENYNEFELKYKAQVKKLIAIYEKRKSAWEDSVNIDLMSLRNQYSTLFPTKDFSKIEENVRNAVKRLSKKDVDNILKPIEAEIDAEFARIELEKSKKIALKNEIRQLKVKIDSQISQITNHVLPELHTIQSNVNDLLLLPELKEDKTLISFKADLEYLYNRIQEKSDGLANQARRNASISGITVAELEESILKLKEILGSFENNHEAPNFKDITAKDFKEAKGTYNIYVKNTSEKLQEVLKTRKEVAVSSVVQFNKDLKAQKAVVLKVGNDLKFIDSPASKKSQGELQEWEGVNIAGTQIKVSECDTALGLIEVPQVAPTSKEGIGKVSDRLKELAKTEATLNSVKEIIVTNKTYLEPKVEVSKALCFNTMITILVTILDETEKRIDKYGGRKTWKWLDKTNAKRKAAIELYDLMKELASAAASGEEDNVLRSAGNIGQKVDNYRTVAESVLCGASIFKAQRYTVRDREYFGNLDNNVSALQKQIEIVTNLKLSA